MIAEGRMAGRIDQVAGVVEFGAGGRAVMDWDAHVSALCTHVGRIAEAITANK